MSQKPSPIQMLEEILEGQVNQIVLSPPSRTSNGKFKITKELLSGATFLGEGEKLDEAVEDLYCKASREVMMGAIGEH